MRRLSTGASQRRILRVPHNPIFLVPPHMSAQRPAAAAAVAPIGMKKHAGDFFLSFGGSWDHSKVMPPHMPHAHQPAPQVMHSNDDPPGASCDACRSPPEFLPASLADATDQIFQVPSSSVQQPALRTAQHPVADTFPKLVNQQALSPQAVGQQQDTVPIDNDAVVQQARNMLPPQRGLPTPVLMEFPTRLELARRQRRIARLTKLLGRM